MIVKQLSEICEQKILQVIINHLQIRKTIIGKWVVSLPEWLELLQVSVVLWESNIMIADWWLVSSSPWCRTGSPLSRWRCWIRCWGPGSPPWTRPASATPCSASWPAASTSESGASLSQPRWWWMRPAGGHPHIRISYIILLLQGCIFLIFSINRKSLRISGAWVASVTTWTWSGKDKDSLMISSEDIISILNIISILSQYYLNIISTGICQSWRRRW